MQVILYGKGEKPPIIIKTPRGIWYSKVKGSTSLFEKAIKKIKIRVTIGGGIFVSMKKLYQRMFLSNDPFIFHWLGKAVFFSFN